MKFILPFVKDFKEQRDSKPRTYNIEVMFPNTGMNLDEVEKTFDYALCFMEFTKNFLILEQTFAKKDPIPEKTKRHLKAVFGFNDQDLKDFFADEIKPSPDTKKSSSSMRVLER